VEEGLGLRLGLRRWTAEEDSKQGRESSMGGGG
jgi:hypothetical protein